jgi:hypothetical protein
MEEPLAAHVPVPAAIEEVLVVKLHVYEAPNKSRSWLWYYRMTQLYRII